MPPARCSALRGRPVETRRVLRTTRDRYAPTPVLEIPVEAARSVRTLGNPPDPSASPPARPAAHRGGGQHRPPPDQTRRHPRRPRQRRRQLARGIRWTVPRRRPGPRTRRKPGSEQRRIEIVPIPSSLSRSALPPRQAPARPMHGPSAAAPAPLIRAESGSPAVRSAIPLWRTSLRQEIKPLLDLTEA